MLGITVATYTVWEIPNKHGIAFAPDRHHPSWAGFLRSQAAAIVACNFLTATTLTATTLTDLTYDVLAVIEHATGRVQSHGCPSAWTRPS